MIKRNPNIPKKIREEIESFKLDFDNQIREIMEEFDFQHVVDLVNWEKARRNKDDGSYRPWFMAEQNDKSEYDLVIPTEKRLRDIAQYLLNTVVKNGGKSATGCFEAENNDGYLSLKCIFEEWQTY